MRSPGSLHAFAQRSPGFLALWLGELVSGFGSGMTTFVLGVWLYEATHSATVFAGSLVASVLPRIAAMPFAGILVDRWTRRGCLLLSAVLSAGAIAVLAGLVAGGAVVPWLVYAALAVVAAAAALQIAAISAVVPQLVVAEDLARASGMMQATIATAQVGAPVVAGVLWTRMGAGWVLWLDAATFGVAFATAAWVRIPALPELRERAGARPPWRADLLAGWRYIAARSGLVALLGLFAAINIVDSLFQAVLTPLALTRTDAESLGQVLSAGGGGMLAGTVVLSVWGGPRRLVRGLVAACAIGSAAIMVAGLEPSRIGLCIAMAVNCFALPFVNACSQAIWQREVPSELQGRVFAARAMVAWSLSPLALALAGPLVDHVFEPLLAPGGLLAGSLGPWFGVGPGSGMALLLVLVGACGVAISGAAARGRALQGVASVPPQTRGEQR